MDRLNHVKLVTPEPELVDAFLRQVVDIPEGWPLGNSGKPPVAPDAPLGPGGTLSQDDVTGQRNAGGGVAGFGGFIAGSTESRQFQILRGERPHIWAVAIGTRDIEGAHERCVAAGLPCTEPAVTPWGTGGIRFFFVEVGGIVFEVMRAEAA